MRMVARTRTAMCASVLALAIASAGVIRSTAGVTAIDAGPSSPPVLPAESWIVYQAVGADSVPQHLRLVRPDGRDDHAFISPPVIVGEPGHPAWSPDGTTIAFDLIDERDSSASIWMADVTGTPPERVAACDLPCLQLGYPAWSPDGTTIAVARYDVLPDGTAGPSHIEIIDVATGARRVVATTPDGASQAYTPRWSPDGERIAYVIETYPDASGSPILTSSIAVVDANSSLATAPTIVTTPDQNAREPDWAPNERILFVAARSASGLGSLTSANLWTMSPDADDQTPVATFAAGDGWAFEPTWVSDGSRIMFTTGNATTGRLWLGFVDPDGTALEQSSWDLETPRPGIWRTHAHLRPCPTVPCAW